MKNKPGQQTEVNKEGTQNKLAPEFIIHSYSHSIYERYSCTSYISPPFIMVSPFIYKLYHNLSQEAIYENSPWRPCKPLCCMYLRQ